MVLTSVITQNIPSNTQSIVISTPSQVENVSYDSTGITYAIEPSFTLSQSDLNLFYVNILQFYNTLLTNFPFLNSFFNQTISVSQSQINNTNGPPTLQYFQTSSPAANNLIYNITFNIPSKIATFAARTHAKTITYQEYLLSFNVLRTFFN